MKAAKMIGAVILLGACASTQPPAQTTTAATQPAATQQSTAVVDPIGVYDFTTVVDGQTVSGTLHIEGAPGNYKGRIVTAVFPEIPIVGASVEKNVITARGSMPDGELTLRMVMEGPTDFKGNWALGGGGGEVTGKKRPR